MLGFVQNIFAPTAHPIGVDFGTDTLRMAQVRSEGDDFTLLAAASADIPANLRADADARLEFFAETVRHLVTQGKFQSRRAVLGLPSSIVHTQRITIDRVEEEQLKDAIQKEAAPKFPFEAEHALLRYAVAGPAKHTADPHLQVVVMAADTRWVNQYIAAAKKARLEVVGMNMQPLALLDCFANVYRRTADQKSVSMYIDIGSSGTRIIIAQGTHLLSANSLKIGGDDLTASVAAALKITPENARTLRLKLGSGAADHADADRVESACVTVIKKLAAEIASIRTEHESLFPDLKIQRLIFVGGEARLENLCSQISDQLRLPGQTGDSLCRMVRNSRIGIESAIDRRHPQPAWASAIGLSIGPPNSDK